MREVDNEALEAKKDEEKLGCFIKKNKAFIINCAYKQTKKYITVSDDEYSVSLSAFSDAIISYDIKKGSFLSFAEQIIRRRLIDFYRKQQKFSQEIQVSPRVFDTEPEEHDGEDVSLKMQVAEKVSYQEDNSLKYEIEAANQTFEKFGFRFYDLVNCSPKALKTKTACAKAVKYILKNPSVLKELYKTKQLPIKKLVKNVNLPRKILERYRKYIIAATEILSGEYPCLAEYMQTLRKELDK